MIWFSVIQFVKNTSLVCVSIAPMRQPTATIIRGNFANVRIRGLTKQITQICDKIFNSLN